MPDSTRRCYTPVSYISAIGITCAATAHDHARLHETLFENYKKFIRPVYNQSEALQVNISFFIIMIHDLVSGQFLCVYVYLCAFVYGHVCRCMCVRACVYVQVRTCICVRTCVYVHVYASICVRA